MTQSEKLILILAGLAVVAIVLWSKGGINLANGIPVANSQPDESASGPAWLSYNNPWGYNPAVGGVNFSVMPTRSVGQLGQVGDLGAQTNFADCGCN